MSYIDVDKFAEKICNFQAIDEDAANAMIWLLRTFPTTDVVEVRHGHWVHSTKEVGVKIYHRWQCSLCGRTVARCHIEDIEDLPYCHCGAKMDGERREE